MSRVKNHINITGNKNFIYVILTPWCRCVTKKLNLMLSCQFRYLFKTFFKHFHLCTYLILNINVHIIEKLLDSISVIIAYQSGYWELIKFQFITFYTSKSTDIS